MLNVASALSEILTLENMFNFLPLLILVLSASIAFAFVYSIVKTIVEMAPKGKAGL